MWNFLTHDFANQPSYKKINIIQVNPKKIFFLQFRNLFFFFFLPLRKKTFSKSCFLFGYVSKMWKFSAFSCFMFVFKYHCSSWLNSFARVLSKNFVSENPPNITSCSTCCLVSLQNRMALYVRECDKNNPRK